MDLAQEPRNVSKACKVMGYSRQRFYEIRRNYQTYGAAGLLDRMSGCKGPHPNRVATEIEQSILAYSLDYPMHGTLRVAQELALRGVAVSAGGVRGVWNRYDLLSKHKRLLRLERRQQELS
ncbi:MAG: helix-turn-helix domain-containing protein, partial [Desulfobulbaceae bacterium]|nr:helix-turn-helix domain-containing protein [Desulfobulbaceae bacterium]